MNPTSTGRLVLDFSDYEISEVPLVGRYAYTHAHPSLKRHIHPNVFEVCVLQRGTQTFVLGEKRFALAADDMFITRPGDIHGTDTEPLNRGCLYWIQFLSPSDNRPFLGLPPRTANILIEPLRNLSDPQFHSCGILFKTFERILTQPAPTTPKELAKASIQNLLLRLLMDIVSLTGREAQPACSPGVRHAANYMAEHCEEPVTIAHLAASAGASESYLKSHFKLEIGMTPMEYLMWVRIEKAKRLLKESEIPITDLAFQFGFSTSQHFATVFKRLTGTTPRGYRQAPNGTSKADAPPCAGTGPAFNPDDSEAFFIKPRLP